MRCVFGGRAMARGPQVTCSAAPYLPEEQAEHPASQLPSQLQSQPPLPKKPSQHSLQPSSQALASRRRSRALLTPPVIIGACGEKPASSSSDVSFQPLAVESKAMWMSTRPTVLVVRPPCSTAMLGARSGAPGDWSRQARFAKGGHFRQARTLDETSAADLGKVLERVKRAEHQAGCCVCVSS